MKSFKPKDDEVVHEHFLDNAQDLFVDEKIHDYCVYNFYGRPTYYNRLISRLGKTVFVFDIDSCEFFEKGEKNG